MPPPTSTTPAPGITTVPIASSEPPPTPHRRTADIGLTSRGQIVIAWRFLMAPFVERWPGISLTRLLAIALALATFELAHDWLRTLAVVAIHTKTSEAAPSWAFVAFVIGGYFVSAVLALGARYIDRVLTIIAAKVGVALANAPLPPP